MVRCCEEIPSDQGNGSKNRFEEVCRPTQCARFRKGCCNSGNPERQDQGHRQGASGQESGCSLGQHARRRKKGGKSSISGARQHPRVSQHQNNNSPQNDGKSFWRQRQTISSHGETGLQISGFTSPRLAGASRNITFCRPLCTTAATHPTNEQFE